ncbi:MAG: TatD family hydrolase [Bacteroidales bacterium]|jgi:TatD DNase family protein|nr:TatD family hydrolase [Bacteroidales bacterium]
MNFIDTHAHLYDEIFENDLDEIVKRSKDNGIYKIFLPNIDEKSLAAMLNLAATDTNYFYPMLGLHPTSVTLNIEKQLNFLKSHITKSNSFIAIGEIGIDLYWSKKLIEQQIFAFEQQMLWSFEYNLPVVIHNRNACDEILLSLKKLNKQTYHGIFHCFSGDIDIAEKVIEMGFVLGIGGIITFKNNSNLQNIIAKIPLNKLVLETDCPYLAPVPFRGKRNESSYIPLIAQKIAEIKSISIEEVAEITTNTALELLNLA